MSENLTPQPNGADGGLASPLSATDTSRPKTSAATADRIAEAAAEAEPQVRDAMTRFLREARMALEDLTEDLMAKARMGYGVIRNQARERGEQTVEMVRDKPYVALGAAVGLGFLVGHLFSAGRTHVIYLKDGRHGL